MNRSSAIWKLRNLPILLLTGPCALGLSVNAALGRGDYTDEISPGWLPRLDDSIDWGQSLILHADRYDLGELRFTDLERNLLIASTNADQFARSPVIPLTKTRETPSHYSTFESDIVGSTATYTDSMVMNANFRLRVHHSFTKSDTL